MKKKLEHLEKEFNKFYNKVFDVLEEIEDNEARYGLKWYLQT